MKSLLSVLSAFLLVGCAGAPRVVLQEVKVAVPVACQADVPKRPAMPTENMPPVPDDQFLDTFVMYSTAEIEIREGYEGQLMAIVLKCTAQPN